METEGSTYNAPLQDVLGQYDLRGLAVEGRDGTVGKVDDATYDESQGNYLVVDTGPALLGKKVFLPTGVITEVDLGNKAVLADVTKEDVKNAPEYDPDRRLDDDLRAQVASHYGLGRQEAGEGEEARGEGEEARGEGEEAASHGTSDKIRSEEPVDNTIHNLVQTLSVKLDSAARYSLYRDDAREGGYEDCIELFTRLEEREQESIRDLKRMLAKHLPDTAEARREEVRESPVGAGR
jgi:hypothetical protein